MKFCKDCKWCGEGEIPDCMHPSAIKRDDAHYPVTGIHSRMSCFLERGPYTDVACGPEGKLWEPVDPLNEDVPQ